VLDLITGMNWILPIMIIFRIFLNKIQVIIFSLQQKEKIPTVILLSLIIVI